MRPVARDSGPLRAGGAVGEETLRMIFLGLIVALAAVAVGVAVLLDNGGAAEMTVFGNDVPGSRRSGMSSWPVRWSPSCSWRA